MRSENKTNTTELFWLIALSNSFLPLIASKEFAAEIPDAPDVPDVLEKARLPPQQVELYKSLRA